MKTRLIPYIAAAALAFARFAAADTAPDLYELRGEGIRVNYSTTGIDGMPHLNYQKGKTEKSFSGDDIRIENSELGTLVSVNIETAVDGGGTAFTLIVPRVNLDDSQNLDVAVPISVVGITTRHAFSPLPQFNFGQRDFYRTVTLKGFARHVVF